MKKKVISKMRQKQLNNMNILALDMATKAGWSTNIHGRRSSVVEFPIKRGWNPQDDNEADACLLLEYALFDLNVNDQTLISSAS
jgi:hypothetical protein